MQDGGDDLVTILRIDLAPERVKVCALLGGRCVVENKCLVPTEQIKSLYLKREGTIAKHVDTDKE